MQVHSTTASKPIREVLTLLRAEHNNAPMPGTVHRATPGPDLAIKIEPELEFDNEDREETPTLTPPRPMQPRPAQSMCLSETSDGLGYMDAPPMAPKPESDLIMEALATKVHNIDLQNIGDKGWNKLIRAMARVHYHDLHQVGAWSKVAHQMFQATAYAIAQAPLDTSARGYWIESQDAVATTTFDLLLHGGVDIPGLGFLQCPTCQEYHATNHDIEVGCAPLRKQFEMEQAEGDILLAKLREAETNIASANKTICKNRITISESKKALSEAQTKLKVAHANLSRISSECCWREPKQRPSVRRWLT
jgi:hypothetical protein